MKHGQFLPLERCHHCNVATPTMSLLSNKPTQSFDDRNIRMWCTYSCANCGGVVLAVSQHSLNQPFSAFEIMEIWPKRTDVSETVPQRAREFLKQAISSIHAPSGAVMLTANAIDAMLKDRGYKVGSLSARINHAADNHLITKEMATWAHEIRLEANDERHADERAEMPSTGDAEKCIEFASALAQFLYVLPARVERGRAKPV